MKQAQRAFLLVGLLQDRAKELVGTHEALHLLLVQAQKPPHRDESITEELYARLRHVERAANAFLNSFNEPLPKAVDDDLA